MKERIIDFINEYPFEMGIAFLVFAILSLINQLNKKHPLKFKCASSLTWRADVFTWVSILMLVLLGLANISRV